MVRGEYEGGKAEIHLTQVIYYIKLMSIALYFFSLSENVFYSSSPS